MLSLVHYQDSVCFYDELPDVHKSDIKSTFRKFTFSVKQHNFSFLSSHLKNQNTKETESYANDVEPYRRWGFHKYEKKSQK